MVQHAAAGLEEQPKHQRQAGADQRHRREGAEVPAVERERRVEDFAHRSGRSDGRRHGRKDITIACMPALRDAPPDYRQHLEIETPEHVVLDLEIAGIGSRALAGGARHADPGGRGPRRARLRSAILAGYGVTHRPGGARPARARRVRWPGTATSSCSRGCGGARRPGKRIAGIRVVMDTGHAVTLRARPPRATCSGSPTSSPRPT